MKASVLFLWLIAASPVLAQKTPAEKPAPAVGSGFTLDCASEQPASALQQIHCETRFLTLAAPPAGTALTVDARTNGGITVRAWAGPSVRVLARVTARAATIETARALAAAVRLTTANHTIRAGLPSDSPDGWAVSYEVLVPAATNLVLKAVNGPLTLENVRGTLRLETITGGLTLRGVGGDVRAATTNGAVAIALTGDAWTGLGLDVSTVHGDVSWQLPAAYTATVLARTTRGRVSADLNTKRLSLLPHNLAATLGKGGAQLKVSTGQGNVRVSQERPPQPAAPAADSLDAE